MWLLTVETREQGSTKDKSQTKNVRSNTLYKSNLTRVKKKCNKLAQGMYNQPLTVGLLAFNSFYFFYNKVLLRLYNSREKVYGMSSHTLNFEFDSSHSSFCCERCWHKTNKTTEHKINTVTQVMNPASNIHHATMAICIYWIRVRV